MTTPPSDPTDRSLRRPLSALACLFVCGGTTLAFGVVAAYLATDNCEDGCGPGSRWAPGAWGAVVELWGLAVPAIAAAGVLALAVAVAGRGMCLIVYAVMMGLLIGWCVFTATVFTGPAFLGLLLAAAGGWIGVSAVR